MSSTYEKYINSQQKHPTVQTNEYLCSDNDPWDGIYGYSSAKYATQPLSGSYVTRQDFRHLAQTIRNIYK